MKKTQKTVNGPLPCKKRKLFDGLIGKHDSDIDPCYKLFLENISIDGDTYVLDVPDGDHGMPISVRYERDTSDSNVMDKNTKDFPSSSLVRSWGANSGYKRIGGSGKTKRDTSEMDESYALFLSLVKFKDGFMVIEPEPGVTIVYEQEKDMPRYNELRAGSSTNGQKALISSTDNMEENDLHSQADQNASEDEMAGPSSEDLDDYHDIICTDERGIVLHTESSDLNACNDDQGAQLALICSGSLTFDKKLNAILNQPYDQNEYEELWRKATDRKPISRQRHLRSASKRYVTKAVGMSYLDHYPDLAIQIESADSDERLNLLRKFFFWLENLCHEGAYMPWISRPLACDPISPDEYEPTPGGEQ